MNEGPHLELEDSSWLFLRSNEETRFMARDPKFVQRGFGLKKQVAGKLQTHYRGGVVDALKKRDYRLDAGDLQIFMAAEYGFCYGVDRAVDYAYETRQRFPKKTLYVTNEIIHNRYVNNQLRDMGFRFFEDGYGVSDIDEDDVVLLPAFGATIELVDNLKDTGAVIVDTTCGSVMNVWKRVDRYGRAGYTAIVHGKYDHEETVATVSRALDKGGHYLVVRDETQARSVIDFMLSRGMSRDEFFATFAQSMSRGFDPDKHLKRIGIANQTTMLASESAKISKMFEAAIRERDGEDKLAENFWQFDTICSATQDRQDAIIALGSVEPVDLFLVIGGYNSSNTSHLCKIASRYAPAFHIDSAKAIRDLKTLEHQVPGTRELVQTSWPTANRPLRLGLTSGASTPNSLVSEILIRVAAMLDIDLLAKLDLDPQPMIEV